MDRSALDELAKQIQVSAQKALMRGCMALLMVLEGNDHVKAGKHVQDAWDEMIKDCNSAETKTASQLEPLSQPDSTSEDNLTGTSG